MHIKLRVGISGAFHHGVVRRFGMLAIPVCCLLNSAVVKAALAYSEPIGLYSVKVAGGNPEGVPARTYLGTQLLNQTRFVGIVTSVSGNTFSLPSYSPSIFMQDAERKSYAHVLTGSGTGFIADIEQFRQSDILCSTNLTPWMSNQPKILIRAHPHLSDIFGSTNRFGLGSGPDAEQADNIVVWDSQSQQEKVYFFHSTRNRWEEKNVNADASKAPVRFPIGLYIVRRSPGTLRIALTGEVGFKPVLLPVRPGANVFSLPVNLSSSLQNLISTEGNYSVFKGPNATSADLLTLEEPATGNRHGPYYCLSNQGTKTWREIGVNGSEQAIQPLELLSTLILQRNGPAGYVLANGVLEFPESGALAPIPSNPEPGEAPLSAEISVPLSFGSHSGIDVYVQKSNDLLNWTDIQYLQPGTAQITFQLPPGESRTFYRFRAAPQEF